MHAGLICVPQLMSGEQVLAAQIGGDARSIASYWSLAVLSRPYGSIVSAGRQAGLARVNGLDGLDLAANLPLVAAPAAGVGRGLGPAAE